MASFLRPLNVMLKGFCRQREIKNSGQRSPPQFCFREILFWFGYMLNKSNRNKFDYGNSPATMDGFFPFYDQSIWFVCTENFNIYNKRIYEKKMAYPACNKKQENNISTRQNIHLSKWKFLEQSALSSSFHRTITMSQIWTYF